MTREVNCHVMETTGAGESVDLLLISSKRTLPSRIEISGGLVRTFKCSPRLSGRLLSIWARAHEPAKALLKKFLHGRLKAVLPVDYSGGARLWL